VEQVAEHLVDGAREVRGRAREGPLDEASGGEARDTPRGD
jgi:hypothetical protein